jgi:pyruvate-formate lyase
VKTRDTASPGYQQALTAHQAVAPTRHVDPGIAEAVERQTRAMRELSRRAFPEPEASSDDQPASIEVARVQRRRESEATRALALRRARAERAARRAGTATVPAEPAPLRTTA